MARLTLAYPRRIYVSASSAEADRASRWMQALRNADFVVTSTWTTTIAVGNANPRHAPKADRLRWSLADLGEVDAADTLWWLAPTTGPSFGAGVELGYARRDGKLIVSSGDTAQSIFGSLGYEYADDETAFAALVEARQYGVAL